MRIYVMFSFYPTAQSYLYLNKMLSQVKTIFMYSKIEGTDHINGKRHYINGKSSTKATTIALIDKRALNI